MVARKASAVTAPIPVPTAYRRALSLPETECSGRATRAHERPPVTRRGSEAMVWSLSSPFAIKVAALSVVPPMSSASSQRPVSPPGNAFCGLQTDKLAARDFVKDAPDLCACIGAHIGIDGPARGPRPLKVETEPVAADPARTPLARTHAAPLAKNAVVHIGAIGEVPDFLLRWANKSDTVQAIQAPGSRPRAGHEPAKLEQSPHHSDKSARLSLTVHATERSQSGGQRISLTSYQANGLLDHLGVGVVGGNRLPN